MNIHQAQKILEQLKILQTQIGKLNRWHLYHNHVYGVAEIAKRIAQKTPNLDPEKAFVLGLLHDVGKIHQQIEGRFHGVVGFEMMMKQGAEDVALSSLLHTFPFNRLPEYDKVSNTFLGHIEDYEKTLDFAQHKKLDDYDLLVQMADSVVDLRGFVTLEQRAEEAERAHNIKISDEEKQARHELKEYWDKKIHDDIYNLYKEPYWYIQQIAI